jgi:hypothetical protein
MERTPQQTGIRLKDRIILAGFAGAATCIQFAYYLNEHSRQFYTDPQMVTLIEGNAVRTPIQAISTGILGLVFARRLYLEQKSKQIS